MNGKKHFVATNVQEYIVPFDRIKHYFGLCIIEIDDGNKSVRLPQSLTPEESIYFDRILFLVIGEFHQALIDDFKRHYD
jgi:hypothetical protein